MFTFVKRFTLIIILHRKSKTIRNRKRIVCALRHRWTHIHSTIFLPLPQIIEIVSVFSYKVQRISIKKKNALKLDVQRTNGSSLETGIRENESNSSRSRSGGGTNKTTVKLRFAIYISLFLVVIYFDFYEPIIYIYFQFFQMAKSYF